MQEFWIYMYIGHEYVKCAKLTVTEEEYELEYEQSYLDFEDRIDIDPQNLPTYSRKFEATELFNSLLDSAPDFWGQQLLNKKFNEPELSDLEYVLANGLEHVGALAYSSIKDDQPMQLTKEGWKSHKKKQAVLEQIIEQTELMIKDADGNKLKELFDLGPTLGGGRPKVSITLDGKFYLAKYGTSLDSLPEQKIEYATMKMAKDIGLNVPDIKISEHSGRSVFMIERFDRCISDGNLMRFHFISALSVCGWFVNWPRDWSYPVFCEFVRKAGNSEREIKEDLRELFKRVAFNIAVNNDDDHPRNHGLLYKDKKWRLAPLYDVFPKPSSTRSFMIAMSLGNHHREASKKNLMSAIKYFELEESEALKIIDDINNFVSERWKHYFREQSINEDVIRMYENAFTIKN
jgi:serine/threonine-protein kinase HipA